MSDDHDLVSNVVAMLFSSSILSKIILVNEDLSFVSEKLEVHNDWDRQ